MTDKEAEELVKYTEGEALTREVEEIIKITTRELDEFFRIGKHD